MTNSYHSEDVQEILQLAMARKAEGREFSRQQLWEMGAELGIAPEAIAQAEKLWMQESEKQQTQQTLNNQRLRKFQTHLFFYVAINTFLVIIDLMTGNGLDWAFWPILGWGLGLLFDAFNTYQSLNN
jgi:2TM domain